MWTQKMMFGIWTYSGSIVYIISLRLAYQVDLKWMLCKKQLPLFQKGFQWAKRTSIARRDKSEIDYCRTWFKFYSWPLVALEYTSFFFSPFCPIFDQLISTCSLFWYQQDALHTKEPCTHSYLHLQLKTQASLFFSTHSPCLPVWLRNYLLLRYLTTQKIRHLLVLVFRLHSFFV